MSNIQSTTRNRALTCTVAFSGGLYGLTTTRGKMAISPASKTDLGVEAAGALEADAHFLLATPGVVAPVRYMAIGVVPTGADATNIEARLVIEQWCPDAEQWFGSPELDVLGDNRRYVYGGIKSGIYHIPVHDGCTKGRIYISGLGVGQGVDITIHPGQHPSPMGTSLGYHDAMGVLLGTREYASSLPDIAASVASIDASTSPLFGESVAGNAYAATLNALLAELVLGQRIMLTYFAGWSGEELSATDAAEI